MPGSQYYMIFFIVILILIWLFVKNIKIKSRLLLFFYMLVIGIMCYSFYNDQMSFEDAFLIGHINSITAIKLVQEIYLSYYLFIAFNLLAFVLLKIDIFKILRKQI